MLFRQFALAAATLSLAKAADLTGYEYVVVGSGAGKLDEATTTELIKADNVCRWWPSRCPPCHGRPQDTSD
jgi:hypothetical protein